jgi:hypothetical protein
MVRICSAYIDNVKPYYARTYYQGVKVLAMLYINDNYGNSTDIWTVTYQIVTILNMLRFQLQYSSHNIES